MINKITIIIVTYNGNKWIKKCLVSVFKTNYTNYNVVVVDNASIDNSVDIVAKEFPQADLISLKKNTGFAQGNNIGIEYALKRKSDAIVLLNQDTEVEADWLNKLVEVAKQKDVGIVQSMLLLGKDRNLINNAGNAMHYLGFGFVKYYRDLYSNWKNLEPLEIGYASGAAMLIKRNMLEDLSGNNYNWFNSLFFMYHEDLDLCWRARLAGYKILLAPKAIVYHYYQFNRNKKMFYWTEKNRWCVLLQNYELKTLLKIAPMLFIIELMMIFYSVISGWLLYKLKSYIWVLKNMPAILLNRRKVQKMRQVSDKEIIKHMDSKLKFLEVSNPLLRYIVSPIVELYYKII